MNHRRLLGMFWTAAAILGLCAGGCAKQTGLAAHDSGAMGQLIAGSEALGAGERDRAVAALSSSIQSNPGLITPRILLGDIYRNEGDYNKAIEQYETLVNLDPYTFTNHYFLGLCYQFLDRVREAAAAYSKALALNPDDAKANMNLGLLHLALGENTEAIRYLERSTALDPESAPALSNLGVALDATGAYSRAEGVYRRSLELDSEQPVTLVNFGLNLMQQGKAPQAIDVLEAAVKKQDTARSHKLLGDAYALAKRYDSALEQYRLALKSDPRYHRAFNASANVLLAKYQAASEPDDSLRTAAVENLKQSLKLNGNQPQIVALLDKWEKRTASAR